MAQPSGSFNRQPIETLSQPLRASLGHLVRVAPGGAAVEVAGIRVELVAVEFRTSGTVLAFTVTRLEGEGLLGFMTDARVTDERGRAYVLHSVTGGGTLYQHREALATELVVAGDAQRLAIVIEALHDPSRDWTPIKGPWALSVELSSDARPR